MKLSYSVLCLLFILGQGIAIPYARHNTDLALFILLESCIISISIAGYLFAKPLPYQQTIAPTVIPTRDITEPLIAQINQLNEQINSLQAASSVQQQLTLQQNHLKEETIQRALQQITHASQAIITSASIIQIISQDIESLAKNMEQERRQHAIEIRTLLGKKPPSHEVSKIALSPLATLLLLLNKYQACHSGEAPLCAQHTFAARALIDLVKSFSSIPIACLSYGETQQPAYSSTIYPTDILHAIIMKNTSLLHQLQPYQPHILNDADIGQWIVFRVHPLDSVIMTPYNDRDIEHTTPTASTGTI